MRQGKMDGQRRQRRRLSSGPLFLGIGLLCGAAQHCVADETAGGTFVGRLGGGREVTLKAWKHYTSTIVDGLKRATVFASKRIFEGEWRICPGCSSDSKETCDW